MAALSKPVDAPKERVADKVISMKNSVKCICCDILLEGREQFVGHMVHSHEEPVAHAEAAWKSACAGIKCALR